MVLLGGNSAVGPGVEDGTVCPGPGSVARTPSVTTPAGHAYDDDAPDPDLFLAGGAFHAITTGTTWGNNLGSLFSTRPDTGWQTSSGKPYGSTALANIPDWHRPGTQWAPGVFFYAGHDVMFYAAQAQAFDNSCLSVATSDTASGPYTDRSTGPVVCQRDLGGSIDPQPFLDADGHPWLHWKNNDGGGSAEVSKVWAVPLGSDGTTLAGSATAILAKDSQRYAWQTTVDNPQMVLVDGIYYLFHTGGDFTGNASYTVGYATCSGPAGPCTTAAQPILRSYGNVAGPGGGTVVKDAAGRWWMSYHAWTAGCTSYSCGGKRKLYVGALDFR